MSRTSNSAYHWLRRLRLAAPAVALAAFGCTAVPTPAQQSPPPAPTPTPLEVSTELVKLDVSVMGTRGQLVAGLGRGDFRVLDNGVEQPLTFFAPVEAPAEILVLIETSPAVYLIENEHLVAAYALLNGLAPDDQVALATYDRSPHAVLAMTSDKQALLAALNQVQYSIGIADLNLYDSLSTALDWLEPVSGKKAVVVLTTGLDSSPPAEWDALVQKARARDVVIFPVALGGSLGAGTGKKKKKNKVEAAPSVFAKGYAALDSLANITGGRAYYPQSAGDFAAIYAQIAAMLRHEYVLGIAPMHDGEFHSLGVEVLHNGLPASGPAAKEIEDRVFVRQGYQAPGAAGR